MQVCLASRRSKLLSKLLIGLLFCSLLASYFPERLITYRDRDGSLVSSCGEEQELYETAHLKLLLTVVTLPKKSWPSLEGTDKMINSTWGQEALGHYRIAVDASGGQFSSPHILHASDCSDLELEQPKHFYCLLKAIHRLHINEYKWFLIASELIYVSVKKMDQLLISLNPNAFLYMGERIQDHTLGHHYCSTKSGLLLSRRALHTIVTKLEACLLSSGPVKASDVVLGWCIATVVHQTCWEMNSNEGLKKTESLSDDLLNRLIFDSIQDLEEMSEIHFFTQSQELEHYFERIKVLCNSMHSTKNSVTLCDTILRKKYLANNELERDADEGQIETKMIKWDMIRGRQLFSSTNLIPNIHLHGDKHTELQQIQEEAFEALKKIDSTMYAMISVLDCYIRYRSSVGREYIVDLLLQDLRSRSIVQRRVALVKPVMPQVLVMKDSAPEALDQLINFIVPAHNVVARLKAFLKSYEATCLEDNQKCKLHIVMYDKREIKIIMKEINRMKQRHPSFQYRIIKGVGTFNRGRARDLGMSALKEDDFAFMCDVDISVDKSFLNRCRLNAIQGKRVYFPIVFKHYNMDFVYPGEPLKPFYEITEQHGYWCVYGYGNICTYKSDYSKIGGFDPDFEEWGGEDTEIAEKALQKSVEVFRAPDPGLVHQFHLNNCSHLTGKKEQFCLGSRNKGLASKVQLADYVYKVKYGV